jgi:serine/threonine protein kinase
MSGRLSNKDFGNYFGIDFYSRSQCEKLVRDYRLGNLIGKGAYGKVYDVCKHSDCKYILKVISYDDTIYQMSGMSGKSGDEIYAQWFNEIDMHIQMDRCQTKASGQFAPHIYDAWFCDGNRTFYIIMEKFDGNLFDFISMYTKLGDHVRSLLKTLINTTFVYKLLYSLDFVHQNCNICINDIKLENILFKKVGDQYLFVFADFGISGQCTRAINEQCKIEDKRKLESVIDYFLKELDIQKL